MTSRDKKSENAPISLEEQVVREQVKSQSNHGSFQWLADYYSEQNEEESPDLEKEAA